MFKDAVVSNLAEGRFNLVIVVDQITDELKRIVPYINSHTLPEVNFYALEVSYAQHAEVEIIQPVTYGIESVEAKRSRNRNSWSEFDYFDALRLHADAVKVAINRLYVHAVDHGATFVYGNGATPSLGAQFLVNNKRVSVWTSYFTSSGPSIDINFAWFYESFEYPALEEFVLKMNAIPGIDKYYREVLPKRFKARPSVPIEVCFADQDSVDKLISSLEDLLHSKPVDFKA